MRRNRNRSFLAIILCMLLLFVSACNNNHTHYINEWTITEVPTLEAEGKAEGVCDCGEKLEKILPALTDSSVWSVKEETPSTCTVKGSRTYTSIYGDVKIELPLTEHPFGEWSITKEPTLTAAGTAERKCVCGKVDTVTIPVLTDEKVWAVEKEVAPTCTKEGSRTYTSVYGKVTILLPMIEHTYGEWTLTVAPSLTTEGSAERACECGHKDTVVVPVLTDEKVWSVKEEVKPTYNGKGSRTYTSVYGEVTIELAKLVAPYDGKTYSSFNFDADTPEGGFRNGVVSVETAWHNTTITFDENGVGIGQGFPFRGQVKIEMVNPETGEILITVTPVETVGETVTLKPEQASQYVGYVDMETGIIVSQFNSSFNNVHVWTPFEVGVNEQANASAWKDSLAINYTFEGTTYQMLVHSNVVLMNVSFEDSKGLSIAAKDVYKSELVVVKQGEKVLTTYAHNGTELVVADGYQGSYTTELLGEVVVNGCGTVTVKGVKGTYEVVKENLLGICLEGVYYELDTKANVVTKPMVNVTFEAGEYATVEALSLNKNIAAVLPTPEHKQYTFKGWFYDAACTKAVEEEFIPTVDVTLYASWKAKVVINLVGTLTEEEKVLYLGEGDIIGAALPKYSVNEKEMMVFRGWFLDQEFTQALPEEAEVAPEDSNITIYAKWEKLPAYYGSYKGTEVWGEDYGNRSSLQLMINEEGVISGKYTGVVESYDPETQVITWKPSATSSKVNKFWFNETLGVIACYYGSNPDEIGTDFNIFLKADEDGKLTTSYGVTVTKPGTEMRNYYARFMTATTLLGEKDFLVYGDHIYDTYTVTNVEGETLTSATVEQSKTVVVRVNGEVLFAVASKGESFGKNTSTVELDSYFGSYAEGANTVLLSGTGEITYTTEKAYTGTYEVNASGNLDVYMDVEGTNTYYELVLDKANMTCAMTKVMVDITFVVGEGHTAIESLNVNKNVKVVLPVAKEAEWVFNGWFFDAEYQNAVPQEFIPTESISLYAKFSTPAELTIVFNNGEENQVIIYSVNDIAKIDRPVKAGFAFVGWYTTEALTEGSEWTNGGKITADTTIYAKWEEAPIYNKYYVVTEVEGRDANGSTSSVYTRTMGVADIDPYGKAPSSSFPINSNVEITEYNKVDNSLVFNIGSKAYKGYVDPVTGIIIINDSVGEADMDEIYFLNPYSTQSIKGVLSSSYWNAGMTRVISYQYGKTVEETFTALIHNNVVYFGVSFKDAEGNAVVAEECYNAPALYIYDNNNELIIKVGYNGTTMVALDGNEGTYKNAEETLVVNGIETVVLNSVEGTYKVLSENLLGVYVNNEYLEITLNKAEKTYTSTKPMVDITFVTEFGGELAVLNTNKNIAVTLETLTDETHVFRGWYLEDTYTTKVEMSYVPTASVTLYAKWDIKVSLTVVYGNTLETVVLEYGAGDTVAPVEPEFTNGKVFAGWFEDPEFVNEYKLGAITEDTTIYVNWQNAVALYGKYAGVEIWGTTKTGSTASGGTQPKSLEIDAYGNVTGSVSGTLKDYNPVTGQFKVMNGSKAYFGSYDELNKVLAINYSSEREDHEFTLGTDTYFFVLGATSAKSGSNYSSYWNAGHTRIVNVELVGYTQPSMNIFMYENKVYANVTFTSTGVENLAAKDAYKQNDLFVNNSEGELIMQFDKSADGLKAHVLDGYQGTYTVGTKTLVLDGYGKGTLDGAAMTYTYVGTQFTVVSETATSVFIYNAETKQFEELKLDALYNKKFTAVVEWGYGWPADNHTFKFTFDGKGNVNISFSCDNWESYCSCSYEGNRTYTLDGTTLTIDAKGKNLVFELNDANNPTSMKCVSCPFEKATEDYIPTDTIFK